MLPVTVWVLDRGKAQTEHAGRALFIDARQVFRQIDRAHRDLTDEQLEFLANIVRGSRRWGGGKQGGDGDQDEEEEEGEVE